MFGDDWTVKVVELENGEHAENEVDLQEKTFTIDGAGDKADVAARAMLLFRRACIESRMHLIPVVAMGE